jgi:hypothetical protein
MNINRRHFLWLAGATAVAPSLRSADHFTLSFEDERHQGDPEGPSDIVSFTHPFKGGGPSFRDIAQAAYDDPVDKTLLPHPNGEDFARRLLSICEEYARLGVSRSNEHKSKVEQFLRAFGFELTLPDSGEPVAFCAAGLCFSACRAYYELTSRTYDTARPSVAFRRLFPVLREHSFLPNPMVVNIWNYARRVRKNAVTASVEPKVGWPVIFSWGKDRKHIGIVKDPNPGGKLVTVEFNTSKDGTKGSQSNGGEVAEKRRSREAVLGYIRLY